MKHALAVAAALAAFALLSAAPVRAADVVVSNYTTNMFGVPYVVGIEKGIFKEVGAPITGIVSGGSGGTVIRNTLASELPFGEVASSAAMSAQREGVSLIVVRGAAHSFDDAWFAKLGSPIRTVKDFAGKRAAITGPQAISEAYLLLFLTRAGVDPASVKRVATGGYAQGLTMLELGAVDVAPAGAPLSTMREGKYQELFKIEDVLPPIMAVVGMTTPEYAKAHPEVIRAILEGRRRAVQYIYAHPQETGELMAKAYSLDPAIAIKAIKEATETRLPVWSTGELDIAELTTLQDAIRLTGQKIDVDWDKLIDLSYLPEDLRAKSKVPGK